MGLLGIFNTDGMTGVIDFYIPDGEYEDLIFGGNIKIQGDNTLRKLSFVGGKAEVPKQAAIVRYQGNTTKRMYNEILDERRS